MQVRIRLGIPQENSSIASWTKDECWLVACLTIFIFKKEFLTAHLCASAGAETSTACTYSGEANVTLFGEYAAENNCGVNGACLDTAAEPEAGQQPVWQSTWVLLGACSLAISLHEE